MVVANRWKVTHRAGVDSRRMSKLREAQRGFWAGSMAKRMVVIGEGAHVGGRTILSARSAEAREPRPRAVVPATAAMRVVRESL